MKEHVFTPLFLIPLHVIVNKGGMEQNVKNTSQQAIVKFLIKLWEGGLLYFLYYVVDCDIFVSDSLISTLTGHGGFGMSVSLDRLLASGSGDRTIKPWNRH